VKQIGGRGCDLGVGLAADVDGAYLTGTFESAVDFGGATLTANGATDAFFVGYFSSGALRMSQKHGALAADGGYAVAVASDGSLYATGFLNATTSACGTESAGADIYLMRITPQGTGAD